MRFLIRLLPSRGGKESFLESVRSLAKSVMLEARNPKWTSYGALELDVFARSKGDFALFLAALEPLAELEFSRDLGEAPPYKGKEELVSEARGYFNSERYWEAHEVLEAIWRTVKGEEKLYIQGVILVCAAFVHHQKREEKVALGVLARAGKQLSYGQSSYYGIDVKRLARKTASILSSKQFKVFRI